MSEMRSEIEEVKAELAELKEELDVRWGIISEKVITGVVCVMGGVAGFFGLKLAIKVVRALISLLWRGKVPFAVLSALACAGWMWSNRD